MRGTRRVAPLFTDSRFDDTASQGLTRLAVDPFEIEREAVIAMLERERRSVLASMIGLAMLAAGVVSKLQFLLIRRTWAGFQRRCLAPMYLQPLVSHSAATRAILCVSAAWPGAC